MGVYLLVDNRYTVPGIPKIYVRDSGLLHALLNIQDYNGLSGHPVVGASWEGFVIENLGILHSRFTLIKRTGDQKNHVPPA